MFSVTVLHDDRIVLVAEQRPDASEEDSFQWMSRVLQVGSRRCQGEALPPTGSPSHAERARCWAAPTCGDSWLQDPSPTVCCMRSEGSEWHLGPVLQSCCN